jgi:hypothetical protein
MPTQQQQPTSTPNHRASCHRGRWVESTIGCAAALGVALVIGAPTAVASPSPGAVKAINDRYVDFGGPGSLLGPPSGNAFDVAGGAEQDYQGGVIYYSPNTGAKVMHGQILEKYQSLGGPTSNLGFPLNDETDAGDHVGRFNDFAQPGGASIYWNPTSGAWVDGGKVLTAWRASGGVHGPFGYPSADMTVADGVSTGRFVGPAGTEIRWSDGAGLATVPAALAASIPGFGAAAPSVEGTVSVPTPRVSAPSANTSTRNNTKWWGLLAGLAAATAAAGLLGLLWRRRRSDVKAPSLTRPQTAAQRFPDARRAPAVNVPRAPEGNGPAARVPMQPKPAAPRVGAPVVDRSDMQPKQGTAAKLAETHTLPKRDIPATPASRQTLVDPVKVTGEVPPLVVDYDREGAYSGGLEITYENNAIGVNQQSLEDKSDRAHQHT